MENFTLVIFGITGNLAQIKLIPALYDMMEKGILPEDLHIVGTARSPMDKRHFQTYVNQVLKRENRHHHHPVIKTVAKRLVDRMYYLDGQLDDPLFYERLKSQINKLPANGGKHNLIFYLATYPELYEPIFNNLQKSGLNRQGNGWVRLMIEKPIGFNRLSARKLNQLLLSYFKENQIFRLDHYLGKETLQNILTFRFGNGIFEPLMNSHHIDNIQITAAEDFGIGGRGGYYDSTGALRDVGQNHLLQMLVLATMDAPSQFTNEAVTKERLKVIQNLKPDPQSLILGQYQGYHKEDKVAPRSLTDTFFAFKTFVQTPRLKGVPIYIRGGKMLSQWVTEISITFKNPSNRLFSHLDCGDEPNVLIYRIQPNEGIVLKILTKQPEHDLKLDVSYMQYCYPVKKSSHPYPDPYERLLFDAIRGDQTFFNDAGEVDAEWKFLDTMAKNSPKPITYKPGSWGPKETDELLKKDGRSWIEPSVAFCNF